MNIEILKAIIVEGHDILKDVELVKRSFSFESHAWYVFVGVRQAGKSYLLYQRALQLLADGVDVDRLLFVNFDDERLIDMTADKLDLILKAYYSMYEEIPVFFLDEIQNIEGWEHFVRRLANLKYQVYVTGSNAKMLSRDIATTLGGRFIEERVFPYSFSEFLTAKGLTVTKTWRYGKERNKVERLLKEYFLWGGFPELLMYVDKRRWLNELYEKIILSDILLRNGVRNELAMRLTVKRLAENIKTPTSYNRLAKMVKGTGVSISVPTVMEYVKMCKDACVIFSLDNYASKFVEKETVKKHYFVDNGLLHVFLTDSETALLENLCALTLYRKSFESGGNEVYFYNKEVELDFYIPEEKRAIQASYSLSDLATEEREVRALIRFHQLYGLDKAEIVTYSEERVIETPSLAIDVVPLSKCLLG